MDDREKRSKNTDIHEQNKGEKFNIRDQKRESINELRVVWKKRKIMNKALRQIVEEK